jgi:hypothetical protein
MNGPWLVNSLSPRPTTRGGLELRLLTAKSDAGEIFLVRDDRGHLGSLTEELQ